VAGLLPFESRQIALTERLQLAIKLPDGNIAILLSSRPNPTAAVTTHSLAVTVPVFSAN